MGWPHATLAVSPSQSSHGSQAGPVTCTTPQISLPRLGLRSDLLVSCASALKTLSLASPSRICLILTGLIQIISELPTLCDAYTTAAIVPIHLGWIHGRQWKATLREHSILLCHRLLPLSFHLRFWCLPGFYEGLALC